jgi:cytochrome c biogenesis protein CcdA
VANALSFLLGFTVGVGAVLALLISVTGAVDLSSGSGHSSWGGALKLLLGIYLLVAAVKKLRGRPKAGEEGSMPSWMGGIAAYSPGRALGAGVVLGAVNPKNVVVGLAAAAAIGAGGLSTGEQVAASAVYLLVAVLGVAAPIAVTLLLGDRAPKVLESWNVWLRQNNATVLAVLFVVFGVVLIGQGIAGL